MPALPPQPWTVALVDDAHEYRRELAAAFGATPGWTCVADWARPREALEGIAAVRPELVLLDVLFPGTLQGPDIVRDLRERVPDLRIVMLTVADSDDAVFRSLRDGAVGYLLKSASWPEVLEHAEDAIRGGSPMSRSIARKVLAEFARLAPAVETPTVLTPAEMQVLERCARGETEAQIAESLGKSRFTVRAQFRSILNKLNAATRAQAVAEAVRRGWLNR